MIVSNLIKAQSLRILFCYWFPFFSTFILLFFIVQLLFLHTLFFILNLWFKQFFFSQNYLHLISIWNFLSLFLHFAIKMSKKQIESFSFHFIFFSSLFKPINWRRKFQLKQTKFKFFYFVETRSWDFVHLIDVNVLVLWFLNLVLVIHSPRSYDFFFSVYIEIIFRFYFWFDFMNLLFVSIELTITTKKKETTTKLQFQSIEKFRLYPFSFTISLFRHNIAIGWMAFCRIAAEFI